MERSSPLSTHARPGQTNRVTFRNTAGEIGPSDIQRSFRPGFPLSSAMGLRLRQPQKDDGRTGSAPRHERNDFPGSWWDFCQRRGSTGLRPCHRERPGETTKPDDSTAGADTAAKANLPFSKVPCWSPRSTAFGGRKKRYGGWSELQRHSEECREYTTPAPESQVLLLKSYKRKETCWSLSLIRYTLHLPSKTSSLLPRPSASISGRRRRSSAGMFCVTDLPQRS